VRIVAALQAIFRDEELTRSVAYGRVYYLKETAMVDQLDLGALASTQPLDSAYHAKV